MNMKTIKINGRMEAVWRCRALVSFAPVAFGCREESGAGGWSHDHYLEILLTEEVLLCWTEATEVAPTVVGAIDTVAGTVRMKSGAVVAARFSRREHLAEEAQ